MVYRPSVDTQLCFVLLPMRSPFLGYFEQIIKPAALEVGLNAIKADDIYGTRAVIRDIWDQIWHARVVVAIVTDKNPNVNYELGICHTLGIPTVLVTERQDDVPFDYQHRRYIKYEPRQAGWEQKLREDLTHNMKAAIESLAVDEDLPWPYDTYALKGARRFGVFLRAEDARSTVINGTTLVARAIVPALGPHGSLVSVPSQGGLQATYKRGMNIALGIRSSDPLEMQGIGQMQHLAMEVMSGAGDGTKTAMLLCHSMLEHGQSALMSGHIAKHVIAGMQVAVETAAADILTQAKPATKHELEGVGITACNDSDTARLVLEALRRVGKDGVVQIVDSSISGISLEIQEGVQFDRGFLSPSFVTNIERQECVLEHPYILIYEHPITSMLELLPLLEQIVKQQNTLLVISRDVSGEALSTLVVNAQRSNLVSAAVKAPGVDTYRRAYLEDLAAITGAHAFIEEEGAPLDAVTLSQLGTAQKVIVTKDTTTIVGGGGNTETIISRVKQVRNELELTHSQYDAERLRQRLAKLGGAVAIIRTGGLTQEEVVDSRYRAESALQSSYMAVGHGYVLGGGLAYYRSRTSIEKLIPKNDAEKAGIEAVSSALQTPLIELIKTYTPSLSATDIIAEIEHSASPALGFNAEVGKIDDLATLRILDPAFTLKQALLLAFSHCRGILKTGAWDASATPREDNTGSTVL